MHFERIPNSAALVICTGLITATWQPAMGQPPRRTIEIYRGTSKQVIGAPPKPANVPSVAVPKAVGIPLPRETSQIVQRVVEQSTDSFRRGLMPLGDHLEQLRVIHRVELQLAANSRDHDQLEMVSLQRVKRLEDMTNRLAAMRQPASAGWLADTLLSRTVLADARIELAMVRGDVDAETIARRDYRQFAMDHFQQRAVDSTLGMASLPTMAAAIAMTTGTTGADAPTEKAVQDFGDLSQKVVVITDRWNAAKSGIGRIDNLQDAKVESAESKANVALMAQDADGFQDAVWQADQESTALFDSRLKFYQTGTSSLFDVTRAWLVRTRVHELSRNLEGLPSKEMTESRRDELDQISRIASSITDLRGRNAADTGFVQLLQIAESADLLTRPTEFPENPPTPGIR